MAQDKLRIQATKRNVFFVMILQIVRIFRERGQCNIEECVFVFGNWKTIKLYHLVHVLKYGTPKAPRAKTSCRSAVL